MHIRGCVTGLLLLVAMLAAGCHGGGDNSMSSVAPAGLTERDAAVVYATGTEIIPDTLSYSGGAITQCSVSPRLPAGLVLDPQTCAITGTPTTVTNDTIYTVTGSNAAGSESTRVEIEVKADVIAPEGLTYLDTSIIYVADAPITPNTPIATGGEITQYSVSPALSAGLSLDPQTGIITGTPSAVTAPAVYTVTGSNSVDSVEAQLSIAVQAQILPPTGLVYSDMAPVFVAGQPVVYDEPESSGDESTLFSVSPALPAGLSINAQTGAISGMPTAAQAPTTYTITGSNSAGSVTAQIVITVNTAVAGEWLPADSMNQGRFAHTATLVPGGQVLVAGGFRNKGRALSSAELYDPASGIWSVTGSMSQARQASTATLLPNGKVLVVGGSASNGVGTTQSSAELYDPATAGWSPTGSMSEARDTHTATLLPNGLVLVAGGEGKGGALASAELYNPATGNWSPTGSMSQARFSQTATLLSNGLVLVAGGEGNGGALSSAQLFAAASLADGRVLVAGGSGGSTTLSSAELYDPGTGTWSQTDGLIHARDFLTATTLPNGRVLAAGGLAQSTLSSDELYDPATGTWSPTASMSQAREQHIATLLLDGRVLIAGGIGRGILSSADLFH